jgi:hypothetical protein
MKINIIIKLSKILKISNEINNDKMLFIGIDI